MFILYSFAEFVYYFILGLGAEVVAGFADAHKSAIASGFPDTIDTYGLVSGRYISKQTSGKIFCLHSPIY